MKKKIVNENTYDISSIKRVTKKFMEVSPSTDPFSAATKAQVLGTLFKICHHIRAGSLPKRGGGNEKNKTIVIFSSSLSPSGTSRVNVMSRLKSLNKLPSATGFQTDATCNIQQCWELLVNNVASVCTQP